MFGRAPFTMSLSSERSTGIESSLRIERGEGMPARPHLRRASAETVAEETGCDENRRRVRAHDATRNAMVVGETRNYIFKVISGVQDGPAVAGDQILETVAMIGSRTTLIPAFQWPTCQTRTSLTVCFVFNSSTRILNFLLAYKAVRDDKTETNWLLLDYENDRSDKLKLTSTCTGGLPELKEILDASKASFAYARVKYSNDKESVREKFILVVCLHPSCQSRRLLVDSYTSSRPNLVEP